MTSDALVALLAELRARQKAAAHSRWLKGHPRQRATYRNARLERARQNMQRFAPLPPGFVLPRCDGPPISPEGFS